MAEWKVYDGSNDQIAEMVASEHGYILHRPLVDSPIRKGYVDDRDLRKSTHYLICEPHPLREMIKQQADTGQPVWIRIREFFSNLNSYGFVAAYEDYSIYVTTKPDWNIPNAEYSFTQFED